VQAHHRTGRRFLLDAAESVIEEESTVKHNGRRRGAAAGATIAIVGAGGNIGSHLVPHVARLPEVCRMILIDRDVYETKNVRGQAISRRDVGRGKAAAQAGAVKAIRPEVEVVAIRDDVAKVPLGVLAGADVILAGLDSLASRSWLNKAAWRVGRPLIDCGVLADAMLARVTVIRPGDEAACLVCHFDERHEQMMRLEYTCLGATAAPTNAPSSLGAAAAIAATVECGKIIAGSWKQSLAGYEIVIDVANHRSQVSRLVRRAGCRFDHRNWAIDKLPRMGLEMTLAAAMRRCGANGAGLGLDGRAFAHVLVCPRCACEVGIAPRLEHRVHRRCAACDVALVARPFDMLHAIGGEAPAWLLRRSLRQLGFAAGDVVTSRDGSGCAAVIACGVVCDRKKYTPVNRGKTRGKQV